MYIEALGTVLIALQSASQTAPIAMGRYPAGPEGDPTLTNSDLLQVFFLPLNDSCTFLDMIRGMR